jgi:hypothetical protein
MEILTVQIFPKALPESMFWLTGVYWKSKTVFWKPHVYYCSGFWKSLYKPTGEFQLAGDYFENTYSLISSSLKGFSHS